MRQLEVLLPGKRAREGVVAGVFAFRVGRGDEPDFTVQNPNQIVEVPGATSIARGFQQLGMGAHRSLDVRAGFGQQVSQNGTGRFLVIAMLGR